MRYSVAALIYNAFVQHRAWRPVWRHPDPRPSYDVVIVGAGGHGLATAYYLAKEHSRRNVAVVEKGWLGGGNTRRNTTVIRSNCALRVLQAFPAATFHTTKTQSGQSASRQPNPSAAPGKARPSYFPAADVVAPSPASMR